MALEKGGARLGAKCKPTGAAALGGDHLHPDWAILTCREPPLTPHAQIKLRARSQLFALGAYTSLSSGAVTRSKVQGRLLATGRETFVCSQKGLPVSGQCGIGSRTFSVIPVAARPCISASGRSQRLSLLIEPSEHPAYRSRCEPGTSTIRDSGLPDLHQPRPPSESLFLSGVVFTSLSPPARAMAPRGLQF
jgi:hypothetical protein